MTIRNLLDAWKNNLVIIVVSVLLCFVASFGYLLIKKPSYTATSIAFVTIDLSNTDKGSVSTINSAAQLANQKSKAYMSLFTDQVSASEVSTGLGLKGSASEISQGIKVSVIKDSPSLQVSCTARDAELAQKIADRIVDVVSRRVQKLEGEKSPVHLQLLSSAALSTPVKSPDWLSILSVGLTGGLLVGLFAAACRQQFDSRILTLDQLRKVSDNPVLGYVPLDDAISEGELSGEASEYLRKIRLAVEYSNVDEKVRSLLITSSREGEGKSTVAINLGKILAYSGEKVLLIDADLRYPSLAGRLGIEQQIGLTQVLAGAADFNDVVQPTDTDNMWLLPSGDKVPNPSEMLSSNKMKEFINSVNKNYFVIIDSAPILPVVDALQLSNLVNSTVLVVGMSVASQDGLARALEMLNASHARLAGLVVNKLANKDLPDGEFGSKYAQYRDKSDR